MARRLFARAIVSLGWLIPLGPTLFVHAMVSAGLRGLTQPLSLSVVVAVGVWYASSVAFNVTLKRLCRQLSVYIEATAAEMLLGSLLLLPLGALSVRRPALRATLIPRQSHLALLNAVAAAHMFGNLCTNYGVQHLNVAFVHTVKSSEPLFALALSHAAGVPTAPARPAVVASLLVIVFGVLVTAASQAQLHIFAFFVSLGSCIGFQARNVLTKRLKGSSNEGPASAVALLGWMSFFGLVQMGVLLAVNEAVRLVLGMVTYTAGAVDRPWNPAVVRDLLVSSSYHWLYNAASIGVLYAMSPVSHSVTNSLKRVFVIILSTIALGDRLSLINCIGIGFALSGAALYSYAKRRPAAPLPLPTVQEQAEGGKELLQS